MMNTLIPQGYKQTEIGVIPEDWEVKSIGEIASVFSGGTPNRKIAEYWGGDIPWVTTTLIDGGEITSAREFITHRGLESSSTKWCKAGTILLAMYGQGKTRGKAALLYIDATINQACAAIELKDASSSQYILHILNSMYEDIRELSNSGGQENLSSGIIKSIQILIPSQKEQSAIATALSDVDALITGLESLIAKKQAIKTATMQQLLTGKTRLPQFAHHPEGTPKSTQQTELGEIPEDWGVDLIGNLLSITTGCRNTQDKVEDGKFPFFVRSQTVERINSYSFDGEGVLTAGDGVGTGKIFHYINGKFDYHQRVYLMHNFGERLNGYFFYIFFSNHFFDRIMSMTAKSSVDSVRREMIANMKMVLPSKPEQTAIAQILSDMDEEIQTLQTRLSKTQHIKQGMMQQLLTGKVRLVQKPKEVIYE